MKKQSSLLIPCLLGALLAGFCASATPSFYPTNSGWTPLYSGVDLATGTNFGGGSPIFAHALRIDLTNPGVRLLASPPNTNNPSFETYGLSVSNFLKTHQLQVAINANDWNGDPLTEGGGATMNGLMISKGVTVSPQNVNNTLASLLFTTSNVPSIVLTNPPPGTNTTGVYTAVTGFYPLVWNGVNMCLGGVTTGYDGSDGQLHAKQPRTCIGYSQDKRYLYLVCIDGRQLPFSDGATDEETADMMILFGVYQGIGLDGGGSATMVRANDFGLPFELNRSSYSLGSGRERVVGSHLGVYALPLPGFINDVAVAPLDTNATVTWTTISNATSQVEYGTTTNLGTFTALDPNLVTNHSVNLTGLTQDTTYYYRITSLSNGSPYYATGFFKTANFTVTISMPLFGVTKPWNWNTNNLDGVNWKATNYNDSAWSAGPGLLYVESSASVTPKNTPLPPNNGVSVNGVPVFQTYYFRTTFVYSNSPSGTTLLFTNYIDDGAVFYLNGVEIQRVRMAAAPTVIANNSVATGSPPGGDATSADAFAISGNLITNLVTGTNVLAVEVHQAASPLNSDITFGTALTASITIPIPPAIAITAPINTQTFAEGGGITITAAGTGLFLTNVSFYRDGGVLIGNDATSPYSVVYAGASQGPHTLTAVVSDSLGQTATSSVVNITVVAGVIITAPTNNQILAEGPDITISAAVTGVSLTNVSFYRDGGVLIGSDATSPYSVAYAGATPGAHTLTAVVSDFLGQTATSSVVTITVVATGIPVGLSGSITNDFGTAPTWLEGWSTANLAGGSSDLTTAPQLDAAIQNVSSTDVFGTLPTAGTVPPVNFNLMRWNTNGLFIESRPNNTKAILLMATLRNNTAASVASFKVSYTLGEMNGLTEQVPGFRVFYSLTGASNTWLLVPALSTGTTGALTATLSVGNWQAGKVMYLLWGDDNASSADGAYTIDDFSIHTVVLSGPAALQIAQSGGGAMTLSWAGAGYTLQQSTELLGTNTPWSDVPGPVTTSPYSTNTPAGSRFYRLRP